MADLSALNKNTQQQPPDFSLLGALLNTESKSPLAKLYGAALAMPTVGESSVSAMKPPAIDNGSAPTLGMMPNTGGTTTPTGMPSFSSISPTASGPSPGPSGSLPGSEGPKPSFFDRIAPLFKAPEGGGATPMEGITSALGASAHALAPYTWGGRMGESAIAMNEQEQQNRALRQKYGLENAKLGLDTAETMSKLNTANRMGQPAPEDLMKRWGLAPGSLTVDQAHGLAPAFRPAAGATSHIVVPNKESSTGFSYMNPVDKSIIAESPAPASAVEKEPKGDFETFKAGHPQKEGESKAAWNERVSNAWETKQDKRAQQKISFGVTVRGVEKEKQEKKIDQMLTPEAISQEAQKYRMTGQLPPTGMSGKGKVAIINEAARQAKAEGQTVEARVLSQAALKASQGELSNLQKQRGVVMSFANTAEKNLALVDDLSQKVNRTGMPVVNRWLLAGKKSIAGDPDVARLDAAMRTAINEYAKVTSSATGGQVTSDSARKEVENMLNSAQTVEQVKAVTHLLRQEMGNRKAGYDKQIAETKGNITGVHSGSGGSGDPLGIR